MIAIFHSPVDVYVRTRDGRNVTFLEPVEVATDSGVRYRIPVGAESDGASTPAIIWATLPPFGSYWLAAAVHDAAYRNTLEQLWGDKWVQANLSKDESDDLLLALMVSLGVPEAQRKLIYEGVHLGGWKAFRDDRKA